MSSRQGGGGGCVVLFFAPVVLAFFLYACDDGGGASSEPPPGFMPTPRASLLHWEYQGSTCADGWPSQSIGRQGACSHHGGVVSQWMGEDGTVISCQVAPPLTKEQRDASIAAHGRIIC